VLRSTVHADGTVDGVVEGEDFYRVRLGRDDWSCSCPMGVQGIFCKHCVAVSLAAAARPTRTTSSLKEATSTAGLPEAQNRILEYFRTSRRDLWRWNAANEYGSDARGGVDAIEDAAEMWGAAALIPTTQKAIAATVRVILRADDSSGIIGDVIEDLLRLHAELCVAAPPPTAALVKWLLDFQFDGKQDLFHPDVARYTNALGESGLNRFGAALHGLQDQFGPPTHAYDSNHLAVRYNLQRLAVARKDPEGIIASFGELDHAFRLHDVAKTLVEIDAIDTALIYAEHGGRFDGGWQAEKSALYWCELLAQHRTPPEEYAARTYVFDTWSTASNAVRLAESAGDNWDTIAEGVFAKLRERHPRELIETLLALGLRDRAWQEAQGQPLDENLWSRLVKSRQADDPESVIPMLRQLIDADLEVSDARNYRSAVKRLTQLRTVLTACGRGAEFAPIVAELRDAHRRRPRLLEEMRRARLDG
jgi:hypothetical protein